MLLIVYAHYITDDVPRRTLLCQSLGLSLSSHCPSAPFQSLPLPPPLNYSSPPLSLSTQAARSFALVPRVAGRDFCVCVGARARSHAWHRAGGWRRQSRSGRLAAVAAAGTTRRLGLGASRTSTAEHAGKQKRRLVCVPYKCRRPFAWLWIYAWVSVVFACAVNDPSNLNILVFASHVSDVLQLNVKNNSIVTYM